MMVVADRNNINPMDNGHCRMESVTDMVANVAPEWKWAVPDKQVPAYRLATLQDELHLTTAFSRMLRELEPLGHDVLPTEANVDLFWTHIFKRALLEGRHGIVLAFAGDTCVGATFFTPEYTDIQTPPGRAVAHGAWVHPDYRQQGVAWRMQAMAHGHLSQLGFTSLISCVVAANTTGLASCKAAGATVVGYMTSVSLAVEGVS